MQRARSGAPRATLSLRHGAHTTPPFESGGEQERRRQRCLHECRRALRFVAARARRAAAREILISKTRAHGHAIVVCLFFAFCHNTIIKKINHRKHHCVIDAPRATPIIQPAIRQMLICRRLQADARARRCAPRARCKEMAYAASRGRQPRAARAQERLANTASTPGKSVLRQMTRALRYCRHDGWQ